MKTITDYENDVDPMIPPLGGKIIDEPFFPPVEDDEDLPTDIDPNVEPMLPHEQRFQPNRQFAPDEGDENDVEPLMIP